jgi:hypothetical protein
MSYLQQFNNIRKDIQQQYPEIPFREAQQMAKGEYIKRKENNMREVEYAQAKPSKKAKVYVHNEDGSLYKPQFSAPQQMAPQNKTQIKAGIRNKIKECQANRKQLIKQLQDIDKCEKIYSQQLQTI